MMYKYEVSIECGNCQRASSKIITREEHFVIFAGCKNCQCGVELVCEKGDSWVRRTYRGGLIQGSVIEK